MLDRMVVLLADHGANDPALRSKSEKWGQAHRANRSSSTEKRRRFNGPELRPSGRRASTLVESTATRLNQHSPADGSTRAAHTRGSLPPRTSTNCTGASSSDDCSAMAKKKCARGRSARLEVVHRRSERDVSRRAPPSWEGSSPKGGGVRPKAVSIFGAGPGTKLF